MNWLRRVLRHPLFIRIFNWEYWSFGMVYSWIFPVWFFLCLRARSLFFFSAANPTIQNGGFLGESKEAIYRLMPALLYPATVYFKAGDDSQKVLQRLACANLRPPLVGKPDIGGRGRGVKILRTEEDIICYAANTPVDFHIQELISFEHEAGIFYYRYPGEETGRLSGIVGKEFLTVRGDGIHSLRQLIQNTPRALLQMKSLETLYGGQLDAVLTKGEEKLLVPFGNHARGAKFLDHSPKIDEQLTAMIDGICRQIPGFYFGRLDIRYKDWEELKQGKNFSVIEVNGAGSEPTKNYEPKHQIFFAWKEVNRQWVILWRISRLNHREGHQYLSLGEGLKMFRDDRQHSKILATITE